jgi:hypothetical protein
VSRSRLLAVTGFRISRFGAIMSAHPTAVLSGVHDVMAAELLAAAAETNAGAREMTRELNDLLTTAYIHNRRAERLNDAAIQVTMFGAHDVAALIGRFAAEEMEAAEEFEAVGASCIRGMHSFGYMSEAEQRFIRRKKFEEGMSTGQAEQVFSQLLDNLYSSAVNFGLDQDGFGADADGVDAEGAEEPDELDNGAIETLGAVAEALGGDMPLVFGRDCYAAFHGVYGASLERLVKRRNRLKARLKKNEEKLETLEESGKEGLRVKFLRRRVEKLEARIDKISQKIKALKGTKGKVDDSEEDADDIDAAETSAVKSAAEADSDVDDLEAELSELDGEEDDDKDDEEEGDEYGMMAEVEVFGASERREDRMEKRLDRLKARLKKLKAKHRGLFKSSRIRRIEKRIAKLEAKLGEPSGGGRGGGISPASSPSYTTSMTSPILKSYTADEYLKTYMGSLNSDPGVAGRQPFVQFFRRQAESHGSLNIHPDVMGAEQEGFFQRIGSWFMENLIEPVEGLFAPGRVAARRERRKARRERARAFIQQRAQALQAKRAAARTARRAAADELDVKGKRAALSQAVKQTRAAGRAARRGDAPPARSPGKKARQPQASVDPAVAVSTIARMRVTNPSQMDELVRMVAAAIGAEVGGPAPQAVEDLQAMRRVLNQPDVTVKTMANIFGMLRDQAQVAGAQGTDKAILAAAKWFYDNVEKRVRAA